MKFRTDLVRNPDKLTKQFLTGIEDFYEHVRQHSKKSIHEFPVIDSSGQVLNQDLPENLALLHAQYLAKYEELTRTLIRSANEHDYIVFALSGRALIETTATFRYFNVELGELAKKRTTIEGAGEKEKAAAEWKIAASLDKHLRGGRFNWGEFYFGDRKHFAETLVNTAKTKSKEKPSQPNPEQINAYTAVQKWAEIEPAIMLCYSFFCELVHPNLGSNFLVMGSKDGKIQVGGGVTKSVGNGLCLEGVKMIGGVLKEASNQFMHSIWYKETIPSINQ